MNGEGLEELRSLSHGFWVLNYDSHCAALCAVCDLDPVSAQTWSNVVKGNLCSSNGKQMYVSVHYCGTETAVASSDITDQKRLSLVLGVM